MLLSRSVRLARGQNGDVRGAFGGRLAGFRGVFWAVVRGARDLRGRNSQNVGVYGERLIYPRYFALFGWRAGRGLAPERGSGGFGGFGGRFPPEKRAVARSPPVCGMPYWVG